MFIMGSKRREFTPEYKGEAVKLVINTGRPVAIVARELGIVEQTLRNWVNAYRARHEAGDGALTEEERAELVRLRKENSELKMDRAFLKKPPSSSREEAWDTCSPESLHPRPGTTSSGDRLRKVLLGFRRQTIRKR